VIPFRQIRAVFDDDSITVYQAYGRQIAVPALRAGRFVPPFGMHRMTWIKPSFLWMMYRCGWATKPGQEYVLAIRLTRKGFEEALSAAVLSHYDGSPYPDQQEWKEQAKNSSVVIQWDPERDMLGNPLEFRSIQIGLRGTTVEKYVREWTLGITDITDMLPDIHSGQQPLPNEQPYPISTGLANHIGAYDLSPREE
jgi:hypothetical protein